MTYTYKKYEWTAFREADLLSGSDTSIGKYDTFVMPAASTVTMSTWDNDGTLSGDSRYHDDRSSDQYGQDASVDGGRVGAKMYAENYRVLYGSDGKTYYLIEIEVEGYNAPGTGDDYFTFYGAVPPAGVTLTVGGSCNVSGSWVDYRCLGAGDNVPANTPPVFTDKPDCGIICIDENTTFVIDVNATDADGDTLTFSIAGGADASAFEIDADTGELTFKAAPDYEAPTDAGGNNVYEVKVKVEDGNGGETYQLLKVCVEDVDEGTPNGGTCIVIEAEDMSDYGFHTVSGSQASGGSLAKIDCLGGSGKLWTTFDGPSGTYDLNLFAQDENDGVSVIKVYVNGAFQGEIVLNQNGDGSGNDNGSFTQFTLDDIQLNTGDTVKLVAYSNCGEFVRIDKIELCQDGEACPEGYQLQDFNAVEGGATVAEQFDGITISAQRAGDAPDSANDAMIFDSANPTGGDYDLATSNLGKLIIISEDGDSSDPDDNAGGGTITFEFDNPAGVNDIKLVDIEENGGTIELFDVDGNLIKSVAIPAAGNNSIQTVMLQAEGVSVMKVNLAGSGAVDDLCWKEGDAPALGSLSGRYFVDENNNDVDDGETGVAGVLVELLDQDGNATGVTTYTDSNGDYSFGDLEAGTYGVKFTDDVSGLTLVDPNVGADDAIDSDAIDLGGNMSQITGIVVIAGADTPDNDAGVEDPGTASLGDTVWFDADKDGIQDADEAGVKGVAVTLSTADGTYVADTTTDADGKYLFEGLDAGDYKVTFDASSTGYDFTSQDVGGDDAADSDADATTGMTGTYTLAIGEENLTVDAGLVDPGTASVGDTVWFDANKNGVLDDGEEGVEGVLVTLATAGGTVIGTVATDANGQYLFTGLDADDYKITFDASATGLDFTTAGADADDATNNDSDAGVGGMTDVFTLDIGEAERDIDAGLVDPGTASLGDTVWFDADGDGQQDADEDGVEGVTVSLYEDGVFVTDTTTDADGKYLFENLDAGNYSVGFSEIDGFDFTSQDVGDDASDSDADTTTGLTGTYTLAIGEANLTVDAGLIDENDAPTPEPDAAMTCADEAKTVDVLANDSDPEGTPLTITMVDGQAITEGNSVTTSAGTIVTLVAGELVIDGEAAYAALDIGEEAVEVISYTVSDGELEAATELTMTFCGDANSVESLCDTLPTGSVTYKVAESDLVAPVENFTFDVQIVDAAGELFDGYVFEEAYCLAYRENVASTEDLATSPTLEGTLLCLDDWLGTTGLGFNANQVSAYNGLAATENVDLITWIVNQDFEENGFTGWEVQRAIWELTDSEDLGYLDGIDPGFGLDANVQSILADATANGEGFVAGVGDEVALVIDPGSATASNRQPFIVTIEFEDYDCLC
ncbi:SdrD B-like domain-containing protein [Celeribacter arenosi]